MAKVHTISESQPAEPRQDVTHSNVSDSGRDGGLRKASEARQDGDPMKDHGSLSALSVHSSTWAQSMVMAWGVTAQEDREQLDIRQLVNQAVTGKSKAAQLVKIMIWNSPSHILRNCSRALLWQNIKF